MTSPLNAEHPPYIPLRPANGPAPLVIARLVWPDGEEYVPAVANRWTRTHVLVVQYVVGQDGRRREVVTWLKAEDVRRSLRLPREDAP
ncbi:MAG: hypothetical protein ACT4QF_24180 [Sporichthyaceae bacterium]